MLFSSATFLFFFLPLSIVLHFLAGLFPKRGRITLQNLLLIGFSLVFFAWANVDAVRILLWLILLNYGIGLISLRFRKILLAGVILNILTLFYYKYPNTAMGWWSDLTSTTRTWDILVPLGISFIVFHNISYLLDIYRGKTQVNKNPIEVALYIVFFPKLIQGPIVKYYDMEGELKNRKTTLSDMSTGAERFIIGLAKKVLVADILAATTDDIFGRMYTGIDVPTAWLGVLLYALVIYTDFSGYSDMAIGLGKMLGFDFKKNFDYPYISTSVSEFWRRWHISLGSWFRDYTYIPLGGNRVSTLKHVRNILVVWALTGLWHGASWNFVLWGVYYGLFLLLEKFVLASLLERLPQWLRITYTMFVVMIGWVFFSQTDFSALGTYLGTLFGIGAAGFADSTALYYLKTGFILFVVSILACRPGLYQQFKRLLQRRPMTAVLVNFILLALSIAYMVYNSYTPFLYAKF